MLEEEFMPEDFDLDNCEFDDYDDDFDKNVDYDEESMEYIQRLTRNNFFKEE